MPAVYEAKKADPTVLTGPKESQYRSTIPAPTQEIVEGLVKEINDSLYKTDIDPDTKHPSME